jgi:hypothetical protein
MSNNDVKLIPLYASGYFRVDVWDGITSVIEYVYHDANCYYYGIANNSEEIEREIFILKKNFQNFLDEEEVYVNDEKTKGKCIHVVISAPTCSPVMIYFYNKIGGKIKRGLNRYMNFYENEESTYPYHFVWWFPEGTSIKKADFCGSNIIVTKNVIIGRVKPGETLCGEELIEFVIE